MQIYWLLRMHEDIDHTQSLPLKMYVRCYRIKC